MSNFVIGAGHTASGNIGCGVVANLDESLCTREISQFVAKELESRCHKVNLLIVDKSNSYNCEDCYVRSQMANDISQKENVNLYVEIHINAGGGTGTEVCVTGQFALANQYAAKICSSLSGALGICNRGVKIQSLIVLNRTSMPAVLVECLFSDSSDSEKYDAQVIAKAIADGLVAADSGQNKQYKLGWNRNNIGWWYCVDVINGYYYTSQNGWKCLDVEWYIFDSQGYALQSAWYYDKSDGCWYYLDENCKMVYGEKDKPLWKCIDGGCYAFDEDGRMYCDCVTPDGWQVDENGLWLNS